MKKISPIFITAALMLSSITPTHATSLYETPEQQLDQQATLQELTQRHPYVAEETDRLIVSFAEDTDAEEKAQALDIAEDKTDTLEHTQIVKDSVLDDENTTVIQVESPLSQEEQNVAVQTLEEDPRIVDARPDPIIHNALSSQKKRITRDTSLSTWTAQQINAHNVEHLATGKNIIIGIVDSGATQHPSLLAHRLRGLDLISDEFYGRDGEPGRDWDETDTGTYSRFRYSDWHGTHVEGDTKITAPEVSTKHFRAIGNSGSGYLADFADAVFAAAGGKVSGFPEQPPVDVINMSLAWKGKCDPYLQRAINYAHARGIPVVVAAGNFSENTKDYAPANCYRAVVVGATTSWGALTAYTNKGQEIDVIAPGGTVGEPVISTSNTGLYQQEKPTYAALNGTSMAAPHVAGVIAMMKEVNSELTVEQIRRILRETGTWTQGYPLVHAYKAVLTAKSLAPPVYQLKENSGIENTYRTTGGIQVYGEPTSHEIPLADGAVVQHFENQYSIYWTSQLGAHPVKRSGAIGSYYTEHHQKLGYPAMSEQRLPDGGYYQRFRNKQGKSTAIYWSAHTGTYTVWEPGAIGVKHTHNGGIRGWGYPTMNESTFNHGAKQTFKNIGTGRETVVYWSEQTGAHSMNARGGIFNTWAKRGGALTLGFPVTDESDLSFGGAQVMYQATGSQHRTAIVWHSSTGAKVLNARGAFYNTWIKDIRRYGYPVTDEIVRHGQARIEFSRGYVFTWSESGGLSITR
ncbi:S8 family serine peptidase [Rothia sp. P7181]|uniref:S8 family serine peptidase n=1 Tax=Rothia sp. P7181 TaxID=3402663 RepID=UPI003ADF03AB